MSESYPRKYDFSPPLVKRAYQEGKKDYWKNGDKQEEFTSDGSLPDVEEEAWKDGWNNTDKYCQRRAIVEGMTKAQFIQAKRRGDTQ